MTLSTAKGSGWLPTCAPVSSTDTSPLRRSRRLCSRTARLPSWAPVRGTRPVPSAATCLSTPAPYSSRSPRVGPTSCWSGARGTREWTRTALASRADDRLGKPKLEEIRRSSSKRSRERNFQYAELFLERLRVGIGEVPQARLELRLELHLARGPHVAPVVQRPELVSAVLGPTQTPTLHVPRDEQAGHRAVSPALLVQHLLPEQIIVVNEANRPVLVHVHAFVCACLRRKTRNRRAPPPPRDGSSPRAASLVLPWTNTARSAPHPRRGRRRCRSDPQARDPDDHSTDPAGDPRARRPSRAPPTTASRRFPVRKIGQALQRQRVRHEFFLRGPRLPGFAVGAVSRKTGMHTDFKKGAGTRPPSPREAPSRRTPPCRAWDVGRPIFSS